MKKSSAKGIGSAPKLPPHRHHLDRRAPALAELGDGPPDDLLTTQAVAAWLGVSVQFLEIGRNRGYGPKYVRVAPARIRYKRADVLTWLDERTFASTSEYADVRGPEHT